MITVVGGATDAEKPMVLFDNLLSRGTLSGSSGLASGAAYANVLGPQTFDYWSPTVATGSFICTLPAAENCDCIFFAAHNLAASNSNLLVQTSPDLVTAYTTAATLTAADLDAGGVEVAGAIFATRSVRRLQFFFDTTPVAPAVAPIIGIAFAGQRLSLPAWVQPPYVPMNEAETLDLKSASTLGGHYVDTSVQRKAKAQDVALSPVARSFVDGALKPFARHYNAGRPFFWAGSPANMPADIGYVWRGGSAGELRPALMEGGQYAAVKMGVSGYGA